MSQLPCAHLARAGPKTPNADGCEDCLRTGGTWVHLRVCLTCGHAGCCDDSPNRHAAGHFRETGHPLIGSMEPGEAWVWCFADQVGLEHL